MINPLLKEWDTPFSTPPFTEIKPSHFKPAIEEAIKYAEEEINEIKANTEAPTFKNTVEKLERSGEKLGRISSVLFNLNIAETTKKIQGVTRDVTPLLTRFSNNITLDAKLFERISDVYNKRMTIGLSTEERILTEKKYRNFLLGGAGLKENDRKRFREIKEELALLSLKFEENVLKETNSFALHLTSEKDLSGLPGRSIEMGKLEAVKRKKEGWVFTLHAPSYIPFMQYCEKRELREKMLRAYASRSFRENKNDNQNNVLKIANLRLELALLLGFSNYAEMILGDRMADTPARVKSFLEELFTASHEAAISDFGKISEHAEKEGLKDRLRRWDWAYYSEKLKKNLYNINDEDLKPYFRLEDSEQAIFALASRLYGISFKRNKNIPVYHPEVNAFEVYDDDKRLLSVLLTDYYPRPGKSGGAWMTTFRDQKRTDNNDVRPIVSIVTNFTRPTESTPSLLSFNELTTFLHEFGHSLHAMLTKCTYESLSGTSVAHDFVELPSQFMENFAYEKEWLDSWSKHYKTGKKIPADVIRKIKEASVFNEGYACNRQLGFAFLDMAWHTLIQPVRKTVGDFEKEATKKTELFPYLEDINISVAFTHIFAGGYAAGYYGYKWAEVLDADAFSYFEEEGIFNKQTAASFRKNILEKGGTENPLELYKNFRGREPSVDPLLRRSGFAN
jgi:peptidyl-dipeptidase Dcp